MGNQAKVTDSGVFDELKAALTKFEGEAGDSVASADRAIGETRNWLEARFGYWNSEVNKRRRVLKQAQDNFERCQSPTKSSSKEEKKQQKDCSAEAEAVRHAKLGLDDADKNLKVAKEWKDKFTSLAEKFQGKAQRFKLSLNKQIASANKILASHVVDLERYHVSRYIFSEMHKAGVASGITPQSDGGISFPEAPTVKIMPNGDAYGSYDDLQKVLKEEWHLNAARNSNKIGFEPHHLLENSQMQAFGFSREDGLCVAIDSDEHMNLFHGDDGGANVGLNAQLSSSVHNDIWDVVDIHTQTYNSVGRSEWGEAVKDYVRANGQRIIAAYETGQVSWSTPALVSKVKQYISSL